MPVAVDPRHLPFAYIPMFNLIISGPYGRMGEALCRLAAQETDLHLLGGLVADPAATPEKSAGGSVATAASLADLLPDNGAVHQTVLVDFTHPDATMARIAEAADLGVGVVIGTTGFSEDQTARIQKFAQRIPVLLSANMSLGINLLTGIIQDLAAQLRDYDIEVVEMHHRHKKDSPSGTALLLARAAAAGRSVDLEQVAAHGRSGISDGRTPGEIGIHSLRGGDVAGDHTVMFAGQGERIELVHKATSRDTFAAGALAAARFLAGQKPGFYSMNDVLGIAPKVR